MDNKQKLLDYLKSQRLMSLATYGDQLSVCAVYYALDEEFNLYFISEPESEHCQNIRKNSKVACSIANTEQKVSDKKLGVQIRGVAAEVSNLEKLRVVLALWNRTNPGFESVINLKNIQEKVIESRTYKITPGEIKFFNEEIYGPEGTEIFKFN